MSAAQISEKFEQWGKNYHKASILVEGHQIVRGVEAARKKVNEAISELLSAKDELENYECKELAGKLDLLIETLSQVTVREGLGTETTREILEWFDAKSKEPEIA